MQFSYFRVKCGINRRPGINRNAGNVILLKTPKTTKNPKIPDANADERCWNLYQQNSWYLQIWYHTLSSTIRCMRTKLQITTSVSIEFENVWVWYVHVTYDDATNRTATLRCRGDGTNSWIAQSSNTKLRTNMRTLRLQKTTTGATSPSCPFPIHIHRSNNIGRPYTGHNGKTLRTGSSEVNSQVNLTG
jgi:hypothetical protein